MTTILVRSVGDVGSAVAHRLHAAGYQVAIHDQAAPPHSRRGMAFTDAAFEGSAVLEGLLAKCAKAMDDVPFMIRCGCAIPVKIGDSVTDMLRAIEAEVLIDARLRKHQASEPQKGQAPLTICLGPDLVAGRDADWVVETAWCDELGQVLTRGSTLPLAGEPRELAGHSRERFLYAPCAGIFRTSLRIGARVAAGDEVARIGDAVLKAPLSGVLRGLTHDGAIVPIRAKVIEVDASGRSANAFGLGERPRRVAEGILAALESWRQGVKPAGPRPPAS